MVLGKRYEFPLRRVRFPIFRGNKNTMTFMLQSYPWSSKILQKPCEWVFGPPKGKLSGGVNVGPNTDPHTVFGRLGCLGCSKNLNCFVPVKKKSSAVLLVKKMSRRQLFFQDVQNHHRISCKQNPGVITKYLYYSW